MGIKSGGGRVEEEVVERVTRGRRAKEQFLSKEIQIEENRNSVEARQTKLSHVTESITLPRRNPHLEQERLLE